MPKPSRLRPVDGQGVNRETGEVIDITGHVAIEAAQGRRHRRKERSHGMFTLVDPVRMHQLELTQHEARVLWAVAGALTKDSGSIARIGTGEIAEAADMLYSNVGAALGSLKKRRILRRERIGVWWINPWLMFAGTADDWEDATDAAEQPEWSRA